MAAHQTPPSLGFSRPEHWSGLPFPSPTLGIPLPQQMKCLSSVVPQSMRVSVPERLGESLGQGVWQATIHGITNSDLRFIYNTTEQHLTVLEVGSPKCLPGLKSRCQQGSSSRGSSRHRDQTQVDCLAGRPRGNPACRGTFGGRRKAVRDRLALQGGTGGFP